MANSKSKQIRKRMKRRQRWKRRVDTKRAAVKERMKKAKSKP